jgi:hypothetical protein
MPVTYSANDRTLTRLELAYLLIAAGAPPEAMEFLVAVASPESGMHTGVTVDDSDDLSYGLWQINMKGSMGQDRLRQFGLTSYEQLHDPLTNARAAITIWKAQGDKAWGARSQITRQHIVLANEALQQARANPDAGPDWGNPAAGTAGAGWNPGESGDAGDYPGIDVDAQGNATVVPGAGGALGQALPSTDEEIKQFILENYGHMASFINHPEVGPKLIEAARLGLSPARLYGVISQTAWWKNTTASEREWQQLQGEDPATANNRIIGAKATISNLAGRLGVVLAPEILENLAVDSLRWAWGTDELVDSVIRYSTGIAETGDLSLFQTQVKNDASKYFARVDDASAADWARKIASGEMTVEGLSNLWAQQARAQFGNNPEVLAAMDKGFTPADFYSQHQQILAETLEMSPEAIDFMGEDFGDVIQTVVDPITHKQRAMTWTEARQRGRDDDRYIATEGARRNNFESVYNVLKTWTGQR